MAYPDDTVTLEVGGQSFTGWQDVRIVRGIEVFPSNFVLRLTERVPQEPTMLSIDPGATCRVRIGSDLVLTGYIDTYDAQISPRGHEITVVGRSGTEDLVDCAAGVTSGKEAQARMTFSAPSLGQLARDLCDPFGISVTEPDGEGEPLVSVGDGIPQFTVSLGQSVYDVLEPIARWKQMLILDGTDGNLVLAKVGTKNMASGFTMPGTAQDAAVAFRKQDRFTAYLPALFAFDQAFDVSAAMHVASSNYLPVIKDEAAFKDQKRLDGKDRYRPHFVVSEQQIYGVNLAELRAKWEKSRRYGRSQAVMATVALWRDSAGTLWTPNMLAPVDMPALKLAKLTWLISQVTFLKGFGGGTRTMATLMPKEGFEPAPSFFTPYDPQVAAAQRDALQSSRRSGQGGSAGQA